MQLMNWKKLSVNEETTIILKYIINELKKKHTIN